MKNNLSSLFACFHNKYLMPYRAGTVIVANVFTVAAAPNENNLPSISVGCDNVPLSTVTAAPLAITLPLKIELTPRVAALPATHQTFLACAPLASLISLVVPVVIAEPAWKMNTAFASP